MSPDRANGNPPMCPGCQNGDHIFTDEQHTGSDDCCHCWACFCVAERPSGPPEGDR